VALALMALVVAADKHLAHIQIPKSFHLQRFWRW
jgi:hypothetical protein